MMNELLTRDLIASKIGVSHDDRDMYNIFGWDVNKDFTFYNQLAKETAIGARCVFWMPKQCWANGFNIDDFNAVDDIKCKMVDAMMRADQLNRIYNFSVLYVGIPDGLDPSQPVGTANKNQLGDVYFQPFSFDGTTIVPESDPDSPRFGLPKYYNLTIMSRGENEKSQEYKTLTVHHSRVVHIAEILTDSNVEGMPYLRPIFKYILALDKVAGGSAEAYFRNARGKYSFEIDPEFAKDLLIDTDAKTELKDSAKKFTNEWQDFMLAMGLKVSAINTPHASPEHTANLCWQMILAYTGLPKRIFTGEGGGQYAGGEDKMTVNAIIDDRQQTHCKKIISGVLEILTNAGMIDYAGQQITFPFEPPLTVGEQAEIADKRAGAVEKLSRALSAPQFGNLSENKLIEIIEQVTGIEIGSVDDDLYDDSELS